MLVKNTNMGKVDTQRIINTRVQGFTKRTRGIGIFWFTMKDRLVQLERAEKKFEKGWENRTNSIEFEKTK